MPGTVVRVIVCLLVLAALTACNSYTLQEAKKNGDLIEGPPDGPLNVEKITQFIMDADQSKESKLRITSYTKEGDAIISDLHFDGKSIQYSFDNSRDKFGGKTKGKSEATCMKMDKRDAARGNAKGTQYVLTGCKGAIGTPNEADQHEIKVLFVYD
jgi:hypothetical protein